MSEILHDLEQLSVDEEFALIVSELSDLDLSPSHEYEIATRPYCKMQGYMDDGHSEEEFAS